MAYIGHSPTNAGTFYILDDLTMGSGTTYGMAVGGVSVSPTADNLLITLDGVIQHPGDAYTVSGSNIVFASGPGSGVEFYGIIMGQSASTGQGSIGADELKVSGDGSSGQVLTSDGDGTFSWATDTENYLPLAGGTMSGAINLGSQNVTNGGTITGTFVGNITGNVTGNASGTAATVTGAAQSAITSVGTLTGLTVAHNNITLQGTGETQLLVNAASGNNAGIRFQENSSNKWTIGNDQSNDSLFFYDFGASATRFSIESSGRLVSSSVLSTGTDYLDGDAALYIANSGSSGTMIKLGDTNAGLVYGGSGTGTFKIMQRQNTALSFDASRNAAFAGTITSGTHLIDGVSNYTGLEVKGSGGSRPQVKWTNANNGVIGSIYGTEGNALVLTSGTGGATALTLDSSQDATFAGELRVNGGQASIYGAEGGNAILELNSDEADDNADRWQMYVFNTNNYLKWRHYGGGSWVDRLWLSSATDNWALNLTGNSPYGMQIITTASNSSSHDMFTIKRGDGTACITTWGDGNTKIENEIQTKAGLRTYATSGANPTGNFYNVAHKFFSYKVTVTSTNVTNGYVDVSHGISRTNVLGCMVNHFGYTASNVNNIGYNPGYCHSTHLYAAGTLRIFIGGSVVAGDYIYVTMLVHGSTG